MTAELKMRKDLAEGAAIALEACHYEDRAQVCAYILDMMSADYPPAADFLGHRIEDARFWCEIAAPDQVAALGLAALDRLNNLALGRPTRKRLLAGLWQSMSEVDRQAFLAWADRVSA